MGISTHILDTTRGRPAAGVPVTLEQLGDGAWGHVGKGTTDADGRIKSLLPDGFELKAGTFRISFDVAWYFEKQGVQSFYPGVVITFVVRNPVEHHHVPLLLNPFGYSTYRGS